MRRTFHTVLIVEDHPAIRMFERSAVEDAGYLSVATCDADAALAVLEHEAGVDVLVTDVQMPGSMDGLELAKTVRER
jgi:two-component system, response regulator PdtaR